MPPGAGRAQPSSVSRSPGPATGQSARTRSAGQADRLDALARTGVVGAALRAPETAHMQFNIRYFQAYGHGLAGRPERAMECVAWGARPPRGYATMAAR